jgi:hypothetical protein
MGVFASFVWEGGFGTELCAPVHLGTISEVVAGEQSLQIRKNNVKHPDLPAFWNIQHSFV